MKPGMVTEAQEKFMHRQIQLMIHELLLFRFKYFPLLVSHTSTVARQPAIRKVLIGNKEIRKISKEPKNPETI